MLDDGDQIGKIVVALEVTGLRLTQAQARGYALLAATATPAP